MQPLISAMAGKTSILYDMLFDTDAWNPPFYSAKFWPSVHANCIRARSVPLRRPWVWAQRFGVQLNRVYDVISMSLLSIYRTIFRDLTVQPEKDAIDGFIDQC